MGNSSLNTTEASADLAALLERATPGPWWVDGPVWNQIIWTDNENRVCFMAHSNGLDDDRDIATAALIALAPTLAAEVLRLRAEIREAALQYLSDTGQMSERIDDLTTANLALAADNARLVKRVEEARAALRSIANAKSHEWDDQLQCMVEVEMSADEMSSAARAWLAGGAE